MENKKIELKDFIYLDTDHITSMLAQINKGNILNITETKDKNKATTDELIESDGGAEIKIKAGLKIFGVDMQRNIENDKTITTNYVSETEQQLISKAMDDYSYDLFTNHLEQNGLIVKSNMQDGNYISINGKFSIFDFNYLLKVIDSIESITNNPYIGDSNISKLNLTDISGVFEAAKDVLSTEHFIFIDNYIIIPNNKFFRYEGLQFILRYNTKVKVLAKIIKAVNSKEPSTKGMGALMNIADSFVPIIKEEILELPKRNEFYYALPIAIY